MICLSNANDNHPPKAVWSDPEAERFFNESLDFLRDKVLADESVMQHPETAELIHSYIRALADFYGNHAV